LFSDEGEKAVEFMIPMPKIPTAGANWRGFNLVMS
jgi:hypothetical protein